MARRSTRKKVPNAEYLLGYVDDNESMDCIMTKFKQLEDYQKKVGRENLTTDDCRELINSTSLGTVVNIFRPRYDIDDDYSSSSSDEVNEGRHSAYMDPVTQSYKTIQQTLGEGQVVHQSIYSGKFSNTFEAVLINPPEDLHKALKLKLKFLKNLIPKGLVFLWSAKREIKEWVEIMEKFKFNYVENLVWVKVDKNATEKVGGLETLTDFSTNLLEKQPGFPFASSHLTLLMFRKVSSGKLELRHQRTCDVVFDFEKPRGYVYHMIETLLPEAGTKLELWAEDQSREGWIHVVHTDE